MPATRATSLQQQQQCHQYRYHVQQQGKTVSIVLVGQIILIMVSHRAKP